MIGQSFYDRNWQLRLLAHLLRSQQFRTHLCSETVAQEDLDLPAHRAILEAAYEFKRQNAEVVQRASDEEIEYEFLAPVIVGMVQSGQIYESEVDAIEDALSVIYDMQLSPRIMLSRLGDFLSAQRVRREVNRRSTLGEIPDTQAFVEHLNHVTRRSYAEGGGGGGAFIASQIGVSCLSNEEIEMTTAGLDSVDSLLGGGIRRGKYGIICAYTGCGKSMYGLQIIRAEAQRGHHARFLTLEMTWTECYHRFLSSLLQIDYELLWKGDVAHQNNENRRNRIEINAQAAQIWNSNMASCEAFRCTVEHFGIWENTMGCTVQSIQARLDQEREEGREITCIVVDYIDKLLLPEGKVFKSDSETTRERLATISMQLEDLAARNNCTIWALTQANDEASKSSYPKLTASRDSRKKNDPATVFLGIGGDESMIEQGVLNLGCSKNRDGRKFHTRIQADFRRQTFLDFDPQQNLAEQFSVRRQVNRGNQIVGQPLPNG